MQIALFLKKFETLIHEKNISKKMICEVLFQNIKKEFDLNNIKVTKGILYINTDSFVKNTIFFKKDKIINDIKKTTGIIVTDIK